MKQYFLWGMAVFIPTGIAAWFLWTLGRSFLGMFHDRKLHRELDELEAHYAAKRQEKDQPPGQPGDTEGADYTARM